MVKRKDVNQINNAKKINLLRQIFKFKIDIFLKYSTIILNEKNIFLDFTTFYFFVEMIQKRKYFQIFSKFYMSVYQ